MNLQLDKLNGLEEKEALATLQKCCGSTRWARAMAAERPYRDLDELLQTSAAVMRQLQREDWLEAFRHHPRIGDVDALRAKFATLEATRSWAGSEQAGTRQASEETLLALQYGNEAYEEKFGFLFIICATGKGADEMLAALLQRFDNEPNEELKIAAAEQAKITSLRLEKLINS